MRRTRSPEARPADLRSAGIARNAENVEVVVHSRTKADKACFAPPSAGTKRDHELAPGGFIQPIEVERAVALVTEELHERRATFLLGRLELALGDPKQVHLERLD